MESRALSWRTALIAVGVGAFALVFLAQVLVTGAPLTDEELGRRWHEATPAWPNYDEDIKAQIGARPFAEWEGEPVSATREDDGLLVAFAVEGPWAAREAAIPILVRDALGRVHRDREWYRQGGHVVYRFQAESDAAALALDSIEVRYPRQTRRLLVQDAGAP